MRLTLLFIGYPSSLQTWPSDALQICVAYGAIKMEDLKASIGSGSSEESLQERGILQWKLHVFASYHLARFVLS